MDDRTLFDRFHEALDIEPRPGAYERMRLAMTSHPVALKRRPALRTRWSIMGLRVAAVLAAAVIAIAVGAAILAGHHGPVGSVPAGADPNVKAYRTMVSTDFRALGNWDFFSCGGVADTVACQAMVSRNLVPLQTWVSDLDSFHTPPRFAVLDGMLRRHLSTEISDLMAMLAYQNTKNERGFSLANGGAFYEVAWVAPAVAAIEGTYPTVAGSYHDGLVIAGRSLDACATGSPGPGDIACAQLFHQMCDSIGDQACVNDAHASAAQVQSFLIGLLQNPASSALAAKDLQIQADLAQVDTYLLAITDAVMSGKSEAVRSAETSYSHAVSAADAHIIAIVGTA